MLARTQNIEFPVKRSQDSLGSTWISRILWSVAGLVVVAAAIYLRAKYSVPADFTYLG